MMRSFTSAVGGLRAHQTKMDVIGNNIANVNTYGFKCSRATFADVYYQSLGRGSAPSNVIGGVNPTQIGYGALVATIDVMNTQSGLASTDRAMDIYINGDGMIVTKDQNGNLFYSRLGILGFDAEGNLVDANGHFVQGFPMGADGNVVINSDGTCDIDDLSRIQVPTEMLDQMTGISIGPNGEIFGSMPGDVTTSVNKKKPDWLTDVIIEPDSDIVGDIKVTMEYRSEGDISTLNANWITAVECVPNSRIDKNYSFSYYSVSFENGIITATNDTTNEILTGTYIKGEVVDMTNAKGETVMRISTDQYNAPMAPDGSTTDLGVITFTETLTLCVEATDKGGNKVTSAVPYDEATREMVMEDTGITLILDPGSAKDVTSVILTYDKNNAFAIAPNSWLTSAYLDPSSTYGGDELILRAGVSQTANTQYGTALNFLDKAKVQELIKQLNVKGAYTIETVPVLSAPEDGFKLVITDAQGGTYESGDIKAPGDDIIIDGITIGTVNAEHFGIASLHAAVEQPYKADFKSVIDDIGILGDYEITMNGLGTAAVGTLTAPDGSTTAVTVEADSKGQYLVINGKKVGIYDDTVFVNGTVVPMGTYQGALDLKPNSPFAALTERNTLQLLNDSNNIISEVQYNGSATVLLGDVSLKVDKDALDAFFATRPILESTQVTLGTLARNGEKDWIYSGNAANAQIGADVSYLIGSLVLAKIPNMPAMEENGQSYFTTTENSGQATFVRPGLASTGTVKAGYLEMSNVDISKEFTDMITTQRGFQANTRIVTVSDEMLQELVNLKR